MKKIVSIVVAVLICFLAGLVASTFQVDSIRTWYPLLNKPELTPPNIVFPIAWSVLYLCMGISIGLVFLSKEKDRWPLIRLFSIQLFLNFMWSILFFYCQSPALGIINILLLDAFATLYAFKSYSRHKPSSLLFIPYVVWLYFATYLNGYILFNN